MVGLLSSLLNPQPQNMAPLPPQPNQSNMPMVGQTQQPRGLLGLGGNLGGLMDFNDPQKLIAMQLIANGQKAPGQMFDGVPQLAAYGAEMQQAKQKEEQDRAARNQTAEFLKANDPALASLVESGALTPAQAYSEWSKKQQGGEPNLMSVGGAIYNADTQQWITPPEGVGGKGGAKYGLNPQTGVDENGNPVLIQLSDDGTSIRTPLPEGVTISKEPIRFDAGTHFILLDPITRNQIGMIPKDLAGAAQQTAEGKALGDDKATLKSMESKMPGLEQTIGKLDDLAEKATYTLAGQATNMTRTQLGMDPSEAAIARAEYIATVDNQILPLLRDTFGAQFTQKEGETLRQTLGDPNKSPKEKQAILKAFIEQKRRDVDALRVRTGAAPSAPDGVIDYREYLGEQ